MKKILVIEDEESIRDNIVELLEDEGYTVTSAPNGRVGVERARASVPDLIISDVMMPEMDGHAVLKTLRAEPATSTTPFIFLSAKADMPDFRCGMELGADDYLTKPFTQDELLQAITSRFTSQALIRKESDMMLDDLRKNLSYALPHELRTPLSGILGPAKMMLDMVDQLEKEDIVFFLHMIHESGERLHRLIQNFFLYAQLELDAGDTTQVTLMQKGGTLSVGPILSRQVEERGLLYERSADVKVSIADAGVAVAGEHLEKICAELVDNGFKFSDAGSPVEVIGATANAMYRLSITDHGKGMSREDIGKIGGFVQFKRKLYEQQGPGLGLTIAKRLIEMHGGTMVIASEPGAGTTVTALLPLLSS